MSNNQNIPDTTWKSQAGFIWSLIGSAVGFANILSFSAQVYKNGGGAFLIPYCMALFILGIPLLADILISRSIFFLLNKATFLKFSSAQRRVLVVWKVITSPVWEIL